MTNEQYAVLTDELRNDPLGRGYANMTDDEVAAWTKRYEEADFTYMFM